MLATIDKHGPVIAGVARQLVGWMHFHHAMVTCGRGKVDGSIKAAFLSKGQKVHPLTVYSIGRLYVNAGYCMADSFADAAKRIEWLQRVNQIEGIQVALKDDKFPPISLDKLAVGTRLEQFLAVMDWFYGELEPKQPTMLGA